MTVEELVKTLKQLENYEEAHIKVCTYGGNLANIESIEWNPTENCYTIFCFGDDIEEGS